MYKNYQLHTYIHTLITIGVEIREASSEFGSQMILTSVPCFLVGHSPSKQATLANNPGCAFR